MLPKHKFDRVIVNTNVNKNFIFTGMEFVGINKQFCTERFLEGAEEYNK